MLSVIIKINGNAITGRSCHRAKDGADGVHTYKVDDGRIIKHREGDGIITLAIKLLEGIKK